MISSTASTPPARRLPDLTRLLVLLDYDGTITRRDTNEVVFQRLVGDAWRPFEDAVRAGEISHAECLDRQVGLLTVSRDELIAAAIEAAVPAPGFAEFLRDLTGGGARVAVVSAGYREAIEGVWRRESLPPVPIFASEVVPRNGRDGPPWGVRFDPALGDCPVCGPKACKAGVLRALREVGDAVAVFGDGVSDLCLARAADIVFARGVLAELCRTEGITYHPLSDYRLAWVRLIEWITADKRA